MSDDGILSTELRWAPPGAGVWWLTREHFPAPLSGLFAAIFPPVTDGWVTGAAAFGLPQGESRWATVNGWFYYRPVDPDPSTFPVLEQAAAATLAGRRWRTVVRDWFDVERPAVVAANRDLQMVDLAALDEADLAEHIAQTIEHFETVAPLHFAHTMVYVTVGWLFDAASEWGLDRIEVFEGLAGASPASAAADEHVARIASALIAAGAPEPASLDDVRAAGPASAAALDSYLDEFGYRPIDGHEVAEVNLIEQPSVIVNSIRSRARRSAAEDAVPRSAADAMAALRDSVPAADRERFDELLADARLSYQMGDDDGGVCFNWPLGLLRRAAVEASRRLVERGAIAAGDDVFEADPAELVALLVGPAELAPSRTDLAERSARRRLFAQASPPTQLGDRPSSGAEGTRLPPHVARLEAARQAYYAASSGASFAADELRGIGVGREVRRGRACVLAGDTSVADLEPGDVLVALSTTSAHNGVFPIVAAVAIQEGGPLSHAAILARELGIPAVIGVTGLLATVRTGDLVEVDAEAGTIRVL